jgi:hypothetical protein
MVTGWRQLGSYFAIATPRVTRCRLGSANESFGASGEIRTLKHLFLRQAAIPIRARWHFYMRAALSKHGGCALANCSRCLGARIGSPWCTGKDLNLRRPTQGNPGYGRAVSAGLTTCAKLAEGRRIERPWLITMPWFSGPVASHSAVPSAVAESAEVEPASLFARARVTKKRLADSRFTVRPTHSPVIENCQRTLKESGRPGGI